MILRHKWLFVRQKWSFMRQKLSFVRQNMLYLRKINITFDWIDGFSKFKNSQKAKKRIYFYFRGYKITKNEENHLNENNAHA